MSRARQTKTPPHAVRPEPEQTPVTVDDRPAHGAHGLEEYENLLPPHEPARRGDRRPA